TASATFLYDPAPPVLVGEISLSNDLDDTGLSPKAFKPLLTGTTSSTHDAAVTIEFDLDGDGVVDGKALANANGEFQFEPLGLPAGNVTIRARTAQFIASAGEEVRGEWEAIEFENLEYFGPLV